MFLFLIATSQAVAQIHVVLSPSKDNTLYESSTGSLSNGAGQHFFAGRTSQAVGSLRRGLVAFNVAGSIPQSSIIDTVILTLNMSRTSSDSQMVSLHRVLADWGEGSSVASGNEGGGGFATLGDATWTQRFFLVSPWSNNGGDFTPTPSASQSVSGVGIYTWGSTPEMVSDVQQWLDNPTANFGWLLKGNESTTRTSKRFDTRENVIPALRPQLEVVYQPPVSVQEKTDIPTAFALQQNYPNPFNPTTAIAYTIPLESRVTLRIYNLMGQVVATLVDEQEQPGTYEIVWDSRESASGVYIYRLQAGSLVTARKLVLLR